MIMREFDVFTASFVIVGKRVLKYFIPFLDDGSIC